jgi:ribonuclease BN (tRNA processing enzyme)
MKKITLLFALIFIVLFASSCKSEQTLQGYLVDTSGKEGFYTGDLPVSSVLSMKAAIAEDVKQTIRSIKKINVAFLIKTADNQAIYEIEKEKLKNIFNDNNTYKNLMSVKAKGMHVKVYYSGDTDAVDEVIAFGYGNEAGVGVARLLGENMNPAKIIKTINSMNFDESSASLKQFSKIFNK